MKLKKKKRKNESLQNDSKIIFAIKRKKEVFRYLTSL